MHPRWFLQLHAPEADLARTQAQTRESSSSKTVLSCYIPIPMPLYFIHSLISQLWWNIIIPCHRLYLRKSSHGAALMDFPHSKHPAYSIGPHCGSSCDSRSLNARRKVGLSAALTIVRCLQSSIRFLVYSSRSRSRSRSRHRHSHSRSRSHDRHHDRHKDKDHGRDTEKDRSNDRDKAKDGAGAGAGNEFAGFPQMDNPPFWYAHFSPHLTSSSLIAFLP